ncbi:hypothetical protein ASE61_07345 [Bosea sp. Root670]|uniref:hypothetical protein n=1 Tax=Bosea sp. Root670 TaxID=1736583 RepID=UPI000712B755|nr:hypothetical protein [Bosea sp. Root670]KRE04725.1 hypothetical protein ASE61_07345 [Bosea sp. Root670]
MAFLKKTAASAAQEFRVPSLAEASPEYAGLIAKRDELLAQQSALSAERSDIEQKIAEAPAPAMRPGVAALLGETSDSTTGLRARLGEVQKLGVDITAALEIIRQRLAVARTSASKAICQTTRAEYGRRVAAIADALKVVGVARAAYDDLRNAFDREDVSWGSLGPLDLRFLGDAREGQVERFIREARSSGYYG